MNVTKEPFNDCTWMLRSGITFDVIEGVVSVMIDGENVGELEVDPALASILPDIAAHTGGVSRQGAMLQHFAELGHAGTDIERLFDTLFQAGLAVRFRSAIEADQAVHISRWTSHIDASMERIRKSRVILIGRGGLPQELTHALSAWSVGVETAATVSFSALESMESMERRPALIITLDVETNIMRGLSRWCIENEITLLPIQSGEQQTHIGPLLVRDASPCPFCSPAEPLTAKEPGEAPSTSIPPTGWSRIADGIADFLSRRPGSDALFLRNVVAHNGRYLGGYSVLIDPRCAVCSRLNRFPENGIIHG
jgi:hypothetical protein